MEVGRRVGRRRPRGLAGRTGGSLLGRPWASDRGATASVVHRWNGRTLLVLSLVLGYVCLLTEAGPTDPLRILLHSVFGGTLFVLLGAKLTVLHVVRGRQDSASQGYADPRPPAIARATQTSPAAPPLSPTRPRARTAQSPPSPTRLAARTT